MWELVSSVCTNGNQILEATEQSVRSRRSSRVTETERKTRLDFDGSAEFLQNRFGRKVEDRGVEQTTVLQDFLDLHLVREWIDLELIEEGSLGTGDLFALRDNLLLGNDIDLSFHNLGLDQQGLEETGLLWIETGGSWLDPHVVWSDHTSLSWGWSHFFVKNLLDISKVAVGQNEAGVADKLTNDLIDVWRMLPGILSLLIIFIVGFWLLVGSSQSGFHQGVLSHDHECTHISKSSPDLEHLETRYVIAVNEEDVLVLGGCLL